MYYKGSAGERLYAMFGKGFRIDWDVDVMNSMKFCTRDSATEMADNMDWVHPIHVCRLRDITIADLIGELVNI